MRVVLDTNVLLSALLSPHGLSDMIYRAWRGRHFELVTSADQLEEMRRASRYPKFKAVLQPHRVGAMINYMQHAIVLENLTISDENKGVVNDANDAFLLAMSEQGSANYLVTGDRRAGLLQLGSFGSTRIITPSKFCEKCL